MNLLGLFYPTVLVLPHGIIRRNSANSTKKFFICLKFSRYLVRCCIIARAHFPFAPPGAYCLCEREEQRITKLSQISPKTATALAPRARGQVFVSTKATQKGSVLKGLHQSGSAKVLFPQSARRAREAVFLNTAGGVTGGDRFEYTVSVGHDSALTITTQACERAYRAQPGQVGVIRSQAKVAAAAQLNWLPQETILFDGAALDRQLTIDLAQTARLLMVEPVIFGRAAMGEVLSHGLFRDRIDITRDGALIYKDAMKLHGDITAHLSKIFIAGGAGAMASLVYVAPDVEARLPMVRDMLPETGGASALHPDMLIMRLLAPDSFLLRQTLIPVLTYLHDDPLPRCWMT